MSSIYSEGLADSSRRSFSVPSGTGSRDSSRVVKIFSAAIGTSSRIGWAFSSERLA
jgi:hypothetical protein